MPDSPLPAGPARPLPAGMGRRLRRHLAVSGIMAAILAALSATVGIASVTVVYGSLPALGLLGAGSYLAGAAVMADAALSDRLARHAISGDTIMIAEGERFRSALRRQCWGERMVALLTMVAGTVMALATTDVSLMYFGVMFAFPYLPASSSARRRERRIAYWLVSADRTSHDMI